MRSRFLFVVLLAQSSALAHDVEPPKPKTLAPAPMPAGVTIDHEIIVPVTLEVDATGRVTDVDLETYYGEPFDSAALAHARAYVFEPARRDGVATTSKTRAVVRFVLNAPAPKAPPARSTALGEEPATQVVVQGRAQPRSASEVVRGRDIIAAAPRRTASDLLQLVPGLFVTQHSGEGKAHQIFLRGFDASHGQDVEIWVAGAPVNEPSNVHGQGYADLHFLPAEVVREVRAQPGTYDPRQGDFAIAGSVRLALGLEEPGVWVKASAGSFGIARAFAAWRPKEAPPDTFAAFDAYRTDGFGPSRAAARGSLVAQVSHDFDSGLSLRTMLSLYATRFDSAGVVLRRDVESERVPPFATYDPRQGGSSQRGQLVLDLHRDREGERWSIAPYVVLRGLALRSNFTGFRTDGVNGDNNEQRNDSVAFGGNASYRRALRVFRDDDVFEAGVSARHDVIEQKQTRADTPLVLASVKATDIGAFVEANLHPLSRLAIRGGLRADVLAYATDDRVPAPNAPRRTALGLFAGPRATVDFVAARELHVVASYGMGFRSPQARALSDGERTPFATVHSLELGARWQDRPGDGARLVASAALFHTRLSQDLLFDPVTARNEPVPATERTGFAADLVARLPRSFVIATSVTFARASFSDGDTRVRAGDLLPYAPQLIARTDAAFTPTIARVFQRDLSLRAGAGMILLARRPMPFGEMGRDIFLLDTSVGARLAEVELDVDMFNSLDARWFDGEFIYASSFTQSAQPSLLPQRHVTLGPPRTAMVSLSLRI